MLYYYIIFPRCPSSCQKASSYKTLSSKFALFVSLSDMPQRDDITAGLLSAVCCQCLVVFSDEYMYMLSKPFEMRLDDVGRAAGTGGHSGNGVGWRGRLRKGLGRGWGRNLVGLGGHRAS